MFAVTKQMIKEGTILFPRSSTCLGAACSRGCRSKQEACRVFFDQARLTPSLWINSSMESLGLLDRVYGVEAVQTRDWLPARWCLELRHRKAAASPAAAALSTPPNARSFLSSASQVHFWNGSLNRNDDVYPPRLQCVDATKNHAHAMRNNKGSASIEKVHAASVVINIRAYRGACGRCCYLRRLHASDDALRSRTEVAGSAAAETAAVEMAPVVSMPGCAGSLPFGLDSGLVLTSMEELKQVEQVGRAEEELDLVG
ncbi:hypothetical protein KCU65_g256, partial [Aureobasidium melanogenum]